MTRLMRSTTAAMVIGLMGLGNVWAGEATTSATATNGIGTRGNAAATANYTGDGGAGIARTRSDTSGALNVSRGLAVGLDRDGLDLSFSHAFAPILGPAYAGTFNMSIGLDGEVSTSYGGAVANGGLVRTVDAGGTTRSDRHGTAAVATASGNTAPGGRVDAWTHTNTTPSRRGVVVSRGGPVARATPAYTAPGQVSFARPIANPRLAR